jgi:acyl dehydratase
VNVDDVVPPLERTITLTDMVAYAGSTWDFHRIHYDPAFLATKGLAAPVIDGQMFGALLAEAVQDWLGPRAMVRKLYFRFRELVFAGESVRCTGKVTAVEGNLIMVEQTVEVVGDRPRVAVAPAGATVELLS